MRTSLDTTLEKVDALAAAKVKTDSPGLYVTIVHRGEVIFSRGYGYENLDYMTPITEKTAFYIASVSKQFTAMSILLLEEQGLIGLDKSVRHYFPEMPKYAEDMTLRHLIHHTSGLRGYVDLVTLRGRFNTLVFDNLSMEDIRKLTFRQSKLAAEVGKQYEYCNTGYVLLASLVERISGMSFQEFTQKNIFDPLGMDTAHFIEKPNAVIPNYAAGYKKKDDTYEIHNTRSPIAGSTGMVCCAGDLVKWNQCFTQCSLGTGKIDLMTRMVEVGTLNDGSLITYAYGLNVEERNGLTTINHAGSLFGHESMFLRYPSEDLAIIILANINLGGTDLSYEIADIILSEYLGRAPPEEPAESEEEAGPPTGETIDTDIREFLGLYRSRATRTAMIIAEEDGSMTLNIYGFQGEVHKYRPTAEKSFVLSERGQSNLLPPERVVFREEDEGMVVDIYYGGSLTTTYDRTYTLPLDIPAPEGVAGSYYCEDIDVVYHVTLQDGKLDIRTMDGYEVEYLQASETEFTFDGQTIEIQRKADGGPEGFLLYSTAVQQMGFEFSRISLA